MNFSLLKPLYRFISSSHVRCKILTLPIVTVLASLSGCAGAELLHLTGLAFQTTFSTKLLPAEGEVIIPGEIESATSMTYVREFWREDGEGKCTYKGIIVPWERTWPKEVRSDDDHTTLLPPEPGVRAGYVALINEKHCKSSETQNILLIGEQATNRASFWGGNDNKQFVDRGRAALTADVMSLKAEDRPLWLPQVIKRLTRLAPTNPAAKIFLEKSQNNIIEMLPDQGQHISEAIK